MPRLDPRAHGSSSTQPVRDDAPEPLAEAGFLHLQTLGASSIYLGQQRITDTAGTVFPLLLRLAYAPGMTVQRNTLLEALWPKQADARQRGSLRQSLYKLRTLGLDVSMQRNTIVLNEAQVVRSFCLDRTSELFERDITRGHEPFGEFLPGYRVESTELQEWLDDLRERVHGDIRRVLVEQLRMRKERADWGGAEPLARSLLQFDPLNEDATFTLAEIAMLAGSKTEAVGILDRYIADVGSTAKELRIPADKLKKRFTQTPKMARPLVSPTERYFLGRDVEMADLTMAMRRARWHDGSATMIYGPPGIGKSRLCNELSKVAQVEGVREIRLDCREADLQRPLSIFSESLHDVFDLPGALGCSPASIATLRKLFGDRTRKVAEPTVQYDSPVVDIQSEAAGEGEFDDAVGRMRASSIRHAVVDLFAAISDERPTLVIVEDVHWIDNDSWEVLSDLIDRSRSLRVCFVLTSRHETVRAERPARMSALLTPRRLAALPQDVVLDLAQRIGGDLLAPLPDHVCQWVVTSCEGNPLLLRALVTHWIETGHAGGIPTSLSVVLSQRIERLDATALKCLQTVTLLGRLANVDRLREVLQLSTHDLITALDQLERSGCLAAGTGGLIVSHELVGRAAEAHMSALITAALRESIAQVLIKDYVRDQDAEVLESIIAHLEACGRRDLLTRFIADNADTLATCGRPLMLVQVFAKLEADGEWEYLNRLPLGLRLRLEYESGNYLTALRLQVTVVPSARNVETMSDSEADQALSVIEVAQRADPLADHETLADAAFAIATNARLSKHVRIRACEISFVIASNLCDTARAVSCFQSCGISHDEMLSTADGQRAALIYYASFDSAEVAKEIAHRILRRIEGVPASSNSFNDAFMAGFALRIVSTFEEAKRAQEMAYGIAVTLGMSRSIVNASWQLALIALDEGESKQARMWTDRMRHALSGDETSAFANGCYGKEAILNNDAESAVFYRNEMRKFQAPFPTLRASSITIGYDILIGLLDPAWSPSTEMLDLAVERLRRIWNSAGIDFLALAVAKALIRLGRNNAAASLLTEYLSVGRRERSPISVQLQLVSQLLGVHF